MPTVTTSTLFYIGNFADMDTNESDNDNENPGVVLGLHDTLSLVDVTNHDQNDNGMMHDNDTANNSPDFISYDTGSGPVSAAVDSTSVYNAVVTLGDGSTLNIQVIVVQSANGDVFFADFTTELDNSNVQSINLTSLQNSNYSGYLPSMTVQNASVVCFVQGTLIATPDGEVPVETLKPGDLVTTLDHGPQEITWVNAVTSLNPGHNAPIILPAGSLGNGLPKTPLRVSPQHRIMLRSRIANRMFGSDEVLLPAKFLQSVHGIIQALRFMPVTYHHFACRRHEIAFANGAEVESFFPGPEALKTLSDKARSTLPVDIHQTLPAPPFVRGKAAQKLLWRHARNELPLCENHSMA